MKKLTLLPGLALISGIFTLISPASAQITINYTDLPYAGLSVVTEKDSTNKLVPGPKSASAQFWDFSSLKKQKAATINFMLPKSTGYAADFPAANLADSTLGGNGYNFFDTAINSFSAEGAEEFVTADSYPFHIEINLSPVFVQSALPASYNSSVKPSIASGMEQFSVSLLSGAVTGERFYDTISYNDTVDAWGTMKMPNGKTYQVLRQNHKEIDYEDVYVDEVIFGWSFYERIINKKYEYNWYAKGLGYILAEMDMDSTSSTVKDVIWDTTAPAPVNASIDEISVSGKVSVYPNPASSQITFQSSDKSEQYITIFDVTGRQLEKAVMKNGTTNLNTSNYTNGLYIYTLTDNEGNITDRGRFMVQK